MVKRFKGGIISATPPITSTSSATVLYSLTDQMQALNAGNWPPTGIPPTSVEYLVVAGGGAGGGSTNSGGLGGGGAGGYRTGSLSVSTGTPYTVTIGAGGTAGTGSAGGSGGNSVFASITSTGGGGGGNPNGTSGGSGGGGAYSGNGAAGTAGQGNNGGNGNNSSIPVICISVKLQSFHKLLFLSFSFFQQ